MRNVKRLVITGLPCPPEAWEGFLGPKKNQRILPIFEVFDNSPSADLRVMSRYVTAQIEAFRPDSIVAHDLGVPLTLMSLLRLKKKKSDLEPRLTLFNGAFRKINIWKANHPFRIQFMTTKKAVAEVERQGGKVDLRLKKYMGKIRAMYRYIILYGVAERLYERLGMDELLGGPKRFGLKIPIQIIASKNDPYIPFESIEQLKRDCGAGRFMQVPYGHFPYSAPANRILPLLEDFEKADV